MPDFGMGKYTRFFLPGAIKILALRDTGIPTCDSAIPADMGVSRKIYTQEYDEQETLWNWQ